MGKTPATVYFGSELRRAREAAGLSREEFGKVVCYAPGTIRAVEAGDRFPSPAVVEGAEKHLTVEVTSGHFRRMLDNLLRRDVYPEWFRPWVDVEQEAIALRTYELNFIPGLLQTEQYARALLRTGGGDTETNVAARMKRQQILAKDDPPTFVALIDEAALRRTIGGQDVMAQQLRRLAEAADQWIIQVVPLDAVSYARLEGPFSIATLSGGDVVYTSTQFNGYVLESPATLRTARSRWDTIRAEAYPKQQSKDLILELEASYA